MTPEEIKKAINDGIAGAIAGIDAKIAELTTKTAEALKPVGDLAARVEAIEKAPKADPKADPRADPKKGGVDAESIANDVLAKLGEQLDPLKKFVEGATQREQTAAQRAQAEKLVDTYLAKNHPLLKGEALKATRARLLAASPADEAALAPVMTAYQEELKTFGVDVKPFAAQPAKEGAQPQADPDSDEAKIAAIRKRGPVASL